MRSYKRLAQMERAFRSMKVLDLHVRPIRLDQNKLSNEKPALRSISSGVKQNQADSSRAGGSRPWRLLAICGGLLTLALSGCAGAPNWRSATSPAASACLADMARFDEVVAEAGVADAGYARIDGFAWLRADRLLASFTDELGDDPHSPAYLDWLTRMRALDAEARRIEAANLPLAQHRALAQRLGVEDPAAAVNRCAGSLSAELLLGADDAARREALGEAVEVADHYLTAWRVAGLYPLTRLLMAAGYRDWKRDYLERFGQFEDFGQSPTNAVPITWYAPDRGADADDGNADDRARWLRQAPRSPLGLLEIDRDELLWLAAGHAPYLAIGTRNHDDRLGSPGWKAGPRGRLPWVDSTRPVADVRLAHTRFQGQVLPQLVYTLWFPARTRSGASDILGGRLDGLIWRVTLGPDGRPLIYDSIHPCGCYHLFFPVPPLQRVDVADDHSLREAPLTPASAPVLEAGQRMRLDVSATSHLLNGLGADVSAPEETVAYRLRLVSEAPEYGRRSLALPEGGRRSLYDSQGLVPDSERLERFLLWPAGIRSPGAMRQWGTHATAFVGRRHFDDAFVFEEAFAWPQSRQQRTQPPE